MKYFLELVAKIANLSSNTTSYTNTITLTALFILAVFFLRFRRGNLPRAFTYNRSSTSYCSVCLDDVKGGERCRKLPKCGHCFHVDCIDVWFQSHTTCPLCRRRVCKYAVNQKKLKSGLSLSRFLSLSRIFSWTQPQEIFNDEVMLAMYYNMRYGH